MKKKELGQYFTTNYNYILQNLSLPENIHYIIEPFAGNGDLLKFIKNKEMYDIECYDIDPKHSYINYKDTLKFPPDYQNKFVITNPPYLARNKSDNKEIYDKYDVNDLYKCFIKSIINDVCIGGIIIIPLNFWCSIRKNDIKLRKDFLQKYNIIKLNIFEEQVFEDTTYTVCCFQFEIKKIQNNNIFTTIYPKKRNLNIILDENNFYTIGGDIYNLSKSIKHKITRLTKKNEKMKNTNLLVKCIDNNDTNRICLSYVDDDEVFIDNTPRQSARSYATLVITPNLTISQQQELSIQFNEFLNNYREKYNSLFLTNYRESKDIARKRISFDLVYNIISHLL